MFRIEKVTRKLRRWLRRWMRNVGRVNDVEMLEKTRKLKRTGFQMRKGDYGQDVMPNKKEAGDETTSHGDEHQRPGFQTRPGMLVQRNWMAKNGLVKQSTSWGRRRRRMREISAAGRRWVR